jgi:hypothetical protein
MGRIATHAETRQFSAQPGTVCKRQTDNRTTGGCTTAKRVPTSWAQGENSTGCDARRSRHIKQQKKREHSVFIIITQIQLGGNMPVQLPVPGFSFPFFTDKSQVKALLSSTPMHVS